MVRFWLLCVCFLQGCASVPDGIEPVTGFEIERYLGTWYEIERTNTSYERDLTNVRGDYSLLPNGEIQFISRGLTPRKQYWTQVKAVMRPVGSKDIGNFHISFGSPLTGMYTILVLDSQYRFALVCDSNRDDLWILSRKPTLDKSIIDSLVAKAKSLGFPTNLLITVEQKTIENP